MEACTSSSAPTGSPAVKTKAKKAWGHSVWPGRIIRLGGKDVGRGRVGLVTYAQVLRGKVRMTRQSLRHGLVMVSWRMEGMIIEEGGRGLTG